MGIGKMTVGAASTIGKAMFGFGTNSLGNVGEIAIGTASAIGKTVIGAQQYVGAAAMKTGSFAFNEAASVGERLFNVSSSFVKNKESKLVFNEKTGHLADEGGGYGLSKVGWAAIAGATAYNGFSGAMNTYEQSVQGQIDPSMSNSTPKIDDAAATGDLVFALHNNRRG